MRALKVRMGGGQSRQGKNNDACACAVTTGLWQAVIARWCCRHEEKACWSASIGDQRRECENRESEASTKAVEAESVPRISRCFAFW